MIHVVLYEPEIPQNTGNIIRTCMATSSMLHMIKPYGFFFDEKHLQRAGMDYIDGAEILEYLSWEDFLRKRQPKNIYFSTRYGHKSADKFDFKSCGEDIYLVFGRESTGIPKQILKDNLDRCIRIPMKAEARSLNLSNCVAVLVYEVLRQLDYPELSLDEQQKGRDFLERNDWKENS